MLSSLAASTALASAQQRLVSTHVTAGSQTTIVADGKIAFTGVAGVADLTSNAPVTARTLYRIGSITKMFTALAVMQLVEQGSVKLDDPLAKFVPGFPNGSAITIRELLAHRSGIANYLDAALADGSVSTPTTPGAIVAAAEKRPPESEPGKLYSYSNTNYVLLGQIVERVSGMGLHAYYAKNIFAPAGMIETVAAAAPPGAALAKGYQLSNGTAPQDPGDASWYYACGDILSTSEDLARFDIALMDGKIVRSATLDAMIAAALPTGDGQTSYGLGIMTFPLGSRLLAGHHGGLPGFESDDEMIVKDRFAVVTLGNDFAYPTSVALSTALRAYYPADLAAASAQAQAARSAATPDAKLTARFSTFFQALLAGKVDTVDITDAMIQALTPATTATIAQAYAGYGPFRALRFVGDDRIGAYHRYHYEAEFANQKKPVTFVLDADGKIAGFQ